MIGDEMTRQSAGTAEKDATELVVALLENLGYRIERDVRINGVRVDIVAENAEGERSPVEIIAPPIFLGYSETAQIMHRLDTTLFDGALTRPLIISFAGFSEAAQETLKDSPKYRYWTAWDLLEKSKRFPATHEKLSRLMHAAPSEDRTSIQWDVASERADLLEMLETPQSAEKLGPTEYENLCMRVFSHVFTPTLYGFAKQFRTTDGANRYDFICRIKPGVTFWDDLRKDFRTRAILFECKNHQEKVTADEVYSTERYLFNGALRTVCFLISPFGPDTGCVRAAQGAMRESGKLILLLSNKDLTQLVQLTDEPDGPENYLDEKIWNFVVSLPR
ncbi:hypothetical protein G6L94_11875 [Agrobacterium rhizogenes]|nr:hypothetical protein [Rhizobium rhizogenes]NTI94387.1 hypothetical protein [Rhizobium rhizogenes]NTJ56854.1 hypothetical protein [Rhizobium rhizogenes]OCJ14917.1 hypothetical protein A6U89_22720 [Agrobacterium sp. B133/95]